ncbi:MAG: transcription termination/antitermination protein NusA [Clostridia bacterium]|nr:transcription termination/antitermination protein NusA [Clostridia bacterium]
MKKKIGGERIDTNVELFGALDALYQERGIPQDYMLEKIEAALLSAYHKEYEGHDNARVIIDKEGRTMKMVQTKTIVEEVTDPIAEVSYAELHKKHPRIKYVIGNEFEVELNTLDFRRLSATAAKSVIIQGIREAERQVAKEAYASKTEEVMAADVVTVYDNGDALVYTGSSNEILPLAEQIPGEILEEGQEIMVYVQTVNKDSRGPLVTLSRRHPNFIRRLFEQQIPEIVDGDVLIRGLTREAGSRTKIAVESRVPEIDAMGACIGNHGDRINTILNELAGEKIDIIRYSEVPEEYIAQALAPAEVQAVIMTGERSARAIVSSDQLSLAIGKEGQNARLAAKLTGMKIDIHSSDEVEL